MLPDPNDFPSGPSEPPIGVGIPPLVCRDLVPPERSICPRHGPMLGAAVPEAAVHENGDLRGSEHDIRSPAHAWDYGNVEPVAESQPMEFRTDRQLGGGISLPRRRHAGSGGFR